MSSCSQERLEPDRAEGHRPAGGRRYSAGSTRQLRPWATLGRVAYFPLTGSDVPSVLSVPGRLSTSAVDRLVAAGAVAFAVAALTGGWEGTDTPAWAYPVAVGASALLLGRRRWSIPVLVAVALARLVVTSGAGNEFALGPAALIALYSVARYEDRARGLAVATAAGVVMGIATATLGQESVALEALGEVPQSLLPVAVADAVRNRHQWFQNRIEAEASARVQAERIRIARDLHDVVAHGLSIISVQSGVASHLLDRDPNRAREALDIINSTGRASLEELRAMVGVLRSTDEAELRPIPTDPDDIGDLLVAADAAGLEVTTTVIGRFPADTADAAVVAIHRILQEALTNVVRHAGPVPVAVRLMHGEGQVVAEVENEPAVGVRRPAVSTGVGVIGMRERAESLGGEFSAGPADGGGFLVRAVVPYRWTDR